MKSSEKPKEFNENTMKIIEKHSLGKKCIAMIGSKIIFGADTFQFGVADEHWWQF